jgi:ABC-2 type transport system permease protein
MAVDERATARTGPRDSPGWLVVAGQECRDLWLGGRGPTLAFAFSVVLSVVTYLAATNKVLNFLEQREAVNLVLQTAVAVGGLMALVVSADALSGERERGTLECLLLTPVSRRSIALGKLTAAMSLWLVMLGVTVPYVWVLGGGVSVVGSALGLGAVVGTLLSVGLVGFGLLVSASTSSNRVSLAVSLFVLLALFAPTQLPAGAQRGSLGDALIRVNPVTAGLHYLGGVLVGGHPPMHDLSYLVSPLLVAVAMSAVLIVASERIIRLREGVW